jgi:DNA-binding beta-propeller fold protein YncE
MALLAVAVLGSAASLFGHGFGDGSFEARHTHSIGLTPDGSRLLALNTPDGRLSVFNVTDLTNPQPVLIAEIPVGIEPVAVRARTNDEVWVVNEVSDSVSVISLSKRTVLATLQVPDEPGDVVFAQGKAFVSCSRNNLVRVFNAATRQPLGTIPLEGLYPRALAVDGSGTKVFAAFLLSGNRTTTLPPAQAPAPLPPTNAALPPAPQTGLIVPASDPRIGFTVLDRDVAEIDAAAGTVTRYLSDVGTNLFDLAIQPGMGRPWIANSEARNLVQFEHELRGHVANHRLTRLDAVTGAPSVFDLNPDIDYGVLPNYEGQETALAQPTGIVFTANGATAWVAAFNSDRVARVNATTGAVIQRVDLRSASFVWPPMRGPRALALLESRQRLYVLNKIANTITVIGTTDGEIFAEIPVGSFDPTFASIREGRGMLFDARLSGNGTVSCATCHLDADVDGLAWDLGDRAGQMTTVMGANLSAHDPTPRPRTMHPMKGPMVTQTLRGLVNGAPFHWRGDRATIQDFNPTFENLMAGSQLATSDMALLTNYLNTLMPHPNPNRRSDNTLPPTFAGGNPTRGQQLFENPLNHCAECHSDHAGGLNNIDLHTEVGATQPIKNPALRTVYQRMFFNPQAGGMSRSGYGLLHDGTGFILPTVHPYALDTFSSLADFADVAAFILCFDPEVLPTVGLTRTLDASTVLDSGVNAEIAVLEQASVNFASELAVQGMVNGRRRGYFYNYDTGLYRSDTAGEPALSRAGLLALLSGDTTLTFLGAPNGRGSRLGGDRDVDAILDGNEPLPKLTASRNGANIRLQWPAAPAGWVLESAPHLNGPWEAVTRANTVLGANLLLDDPLAGAAARFYRLRRTW